MDKKQFNSGFGKLLYFLYPLLIYLSINIIVSTVAEIIIVSSITKDNPTIGSSELFDLLYDKILQFNDILTLAIAAIGVIVFGIMFFRHEYHGFDKKYQNLLKPLDIASITSVSMGYYMAINVILIIIIANFGQSEIIINYTETMESILGDNLWLAILSVGIITPICEELLFRGLIFNRIRIYTGETKAIVLSAAIFGAMHFTSVIQMAYAFVLGGLLAYAYSKYENIIAPIMIHAIFNLANFLFMIDALSNATETKISALIYYAVCVVLLAFGIRQLRKKAKPSLKL